MKDTGWGMPQDGWGASKDLKQTAVLGGDKPTLLGGGGGGWDAMSSTMTDH